MTFRNSKVVATERAFPHIIEIALPVNGLSVRLNREMIVFHRSRDIQLHFGRAILRTDQRYSRWCFSDPAVANSFLEQFGGTYVTLKP
jgi:hypothetical protein